VDTRIVDNEVIATPRRQRVAITGAGRSMKDLPWNDPTWELWGINNFWNAMRDEEDRLRADRWFELHPPTTDIQDPFDMIWLRDCPVPIYTTEPFPDNPNAVVFPVDELAANYRDYFACTFAYQIAFAIDEGFKEIAVHGLELAYGTQREATVERSCVDWWLGYAEGRGIKITIPEGDHVATHWRRYGFDYWPEARTVEQYVGSLIGRKVAE
jgi:hypothetical protein|tara:strand:- start:33175 stop:33810 length:636 start_codon:yes stop_codon:yes gene_type:complete